MPGLNENYKEAEMAADYNRLEEMAMRLCNSHENSRMYDYRSLLNNGISAYRSVRNTYEGAQLDDDLKNIQREKERLDMKYGKGEYAAIPQKDRSRMAGIQENYDRCYYQMDRAKTRKEFEMGSNTVDAMDRRDGLIGKIMNITLGNGKAQRDYSYSMTEYSNRLQELDIRYGGEPKTMLQEGVFRQNNRSPIIRDDRGNSTSQRQTREISIERLRDLNSQKNDNRTDMEKFRGKDVKTVADEGLKSSKSSKLVFQNNSFHIK